MMKKSFLGLKPLLALFLFLALTYSHLQAAAPSSVAGWTFFVRITEGEFGMGDSGSFLLCLGDTNSECRIISMSDIEDNVGTYTYQASGSDGKVTMGNIVMTFSFTDDRRGNYGLVRGGSVSGGYQLGKFSAAGGTAPRSLTNSVLDFVGKRGDLPAVKVNYRLLTGATNTYSKMDGAVSGQVNAFAVQRINKSTTRIFFNDGVLGTGNDHLIFTTPSNGLFAYKIGSGKFYEQGTFTLQHAAEPTITLQPKDQAVVYGGRAAFTVGATGAKPFAYQWYKNNALIAGATQSRYVVNPVSASDDASYHVTVSNFLGSDVSDDARLEALCPTTLGGTFQWFDYLGGSNGSVSVTSDCSWGATTTNSWIKDFSGFGGDTLTFSVEANTNAAARTGYIRIGTKPFKVAQQGTFTPSNLVGKTLRLDSDVGMEFHATLRGSASSFWYSRLDGVNTNLFPYSYQRLSETVARVNLFSNETVLLTFTDFIHGTYVLTNTNDNSTVEGPFTLSKRRGDLTIDGHPDLYWRNKTNGQIRLSLTYGSFVTNVIDTNISPRLVGINDFTRDGSLDFLSLSTQRVLVADTELTNLITFRSGTPVAPGWRVVSTEDLSGDDRADVLFQNNDGRLAYWQISTNTNYFSRAVSVRNGKPAAANWLAVSAADMDGDRQQDVVLWNRENGNAAVWYFNNGDFVNSAFLTDTNNILGTEWRIRSVADMNYDGRNDLLWQNNTNGAVEIWHLNGSNVDSQPYTATVTDPVWLLLGPK